MKPRAVIHRGATPEEMAEIYGISPSRVRTLERLLLRSRSEKARSIGNNGVKPMTHAKTVKNGGRNEKRSS